MKLYRFKTFTTSYYFPGIDSSLNFMYGLYSAYGSKLSKCCWWIFRHSRLVRNLFRCEVSELPFPYTLIRELDGNNCVMAFNMGSPGVEQKLSMLGYDYTEDQPFFAKFSQSEIARHLTINEINIYRLLVGTGLTPKLYMAIENEQYVYLKAEYVSGKRPRLTSVTPQVIDICLLLSQYHLTDEKKNSEGLALTLSHGDFCPWNMLERKSYIRLVDWELAKDRPLGYDLFTYVFQVPFLLTPEKPIPTIFEESKEYFEMYFKQMGVNNYIPYLKSFAKNKYEYETYKNGNLAPKYAELSMWISRNM